MLQFLAFVILIATEPVAAERNDPEYPCGVHALYVACRMAGLSCGIAEVQAVVERDAKGISSLEGLRSATQRLGGHAVVAYHRRRTPETLVPGSIVHFRATAPDSEPHFSVYVGISRTGRVILADAPIPPYSIEQKQFTRDWTGYALTVFQARSDADSYSAKMRRLPDSLTAIGLLAAVALLLVAAATLSRPFRRLRRSRILVLHLFVLLGTANCAGCRDTSSVGSDLLLPARNVNAGFVPPSGKKIDIPIINRSRLST